MYRPVSRSLHRSGADPEVAHFRATVHDPVEFLHDILKITELPGHPQFPYRVALHNGCHSLRYLNEARPTELMIKPFDKCADLLKLVDGLEVGYATRRDECCGFGGTYSIWDPSCSGATGTRQGKRLCPQRFQVCDIAGHVVHDTPTDNSPQERTRSENVLYH